MSICRLLKCVSTDYWKSFYYLFVFVFLKQQTTNDIKYTTIGDSIYNRICVYIVKSELV